MARVLQMQEDEGLDAAKEAIAAGTGREAMVKIRTLVNDMERHEHELLAGPSKPIATPTVRTS